MKKQEQTLYEHDSTMEHELDYVIADDSKGEEPSMDDALHQQQKTYYRGSGNKQNNLEDTVNDFFDKAVDGFSTLLNLSVKAGKRAYKDYKIRKNLDFTILNDDELEKLVADYREYYRQFCINLLMLFGSFSSLMLMPFVEFSGGLILGCFGLCVALLALGIYRLVKSSISYRKSTASVRGKTVQITPKAEKWIKKMEKTNHTNMARSIAFAICCYILPMFGFVGIAITFPFFDSLMALWMGIYMLLIALGTGLMVNTIGMNAIYHNILDHRRFR